MNGILHGWTVLKSALKHNSKVKLRTVTLFKGIAEATIRCNESQEGEIPIYIIRYFISIIFKLNPGIRQNINIKSTEKMQ